MKVKKSEEEILRLNRELSILYGISLTVNESLDLDEILSKTLDKLLELTDVPSAGIYLLDKKSNDLLFVSRRGFSSPFSKHMKQMKLGEGITGKVALTGESIFVEDYPNHPAAIPRAVEEGVKCLAVVPLKAREKIKAWQKEEIKEFSKAAAVGGGRVFSFPLERRGKSFSLRQFYGTVKDLNETMKDWKGT